MAELDNDKTGTVLFFSPQRGYGFIGRDNGEKDLFVHWANIDMEGYKTLKQGQVVSFEIGNNHKGIQAVNVKVIKDVEDAKQEDQEEEKE